jgi:CRISPR/Cas system-associated endonuclease Cas3-HD
METFKDYFLNEINIKYVPGIKYLGIETEIVKENVLGFSFTTFLDKEVINDKDSEKQNEENAKMFIKIMEKEFGDKYKLVQKNNQVQIEFSPKEFRIYKLHFPWVQEMQKSNVKLSNSKKKVYQTIVKNTDVIDLFTNLVNMIFEKNSML